MFEPQKGILLVFTQSELHTYLGTWTINQSLDCETYGVIHNALSSSYLPREVYAMASNKLHQVQLFVNQRWSVPAHLHLQEMVGSCAGPPMRPHLDTVLRAEHHG